MDERRRAFERRAAQGDEEAQERLRAERRRAAEDRVWLPATVGTRPVGVAEVVGRHIRAPLAGAVLWLRRPRGMWEPVSRPATPEDFATAQALTGR